MRILIIDDDQAMVRSLIRALNRQYAVDTVVTAQDGEVAATTTDFDLILLDYQLPDQDGVTLCKTLRALEITTPILMMTGYSALSDAVKALNAGADDYLTKPFRLPELEARIRALLRRHHTTRLPTLRAGDLTYSPVSKTVMRAGHTILLRPKSLQLLEFLLRHKGSILSREQITEHLWSADDEPFTNAVDVHMKFLRDRIDRPFSHTLITTVHRMGYKIDD